MSGRLFIVATPIGNLGDISHRAVETLSKVDLIAAEDTRHSSKLLTHLGIKKPMLSIHSHNENERSARVITELKEGSNIALISDAGTPLISDPGFPLVREARAEGIQIITIPGPSALIAALSISGLPCDRFVFEGFLPAKSTARLKLLQTLAAEDRTMVFYESPHRIIASIKDMASVFGPDRVAVIARELTKTFEQTEKASLAGLSDWLQQSTNHQRGEMVIVLSGVEKKTSIANIASSDLLEKLLIHLPVKEAARLTSEITGEPRNQLYQQALNLRQKNDR